MDELQAEDQEQYEQYVAKLGKWRKEALAALSDAGWWLTLLISHRAREPWEHFHNKVKQRSAYPTGDDHGDVSFAAALVWDGGDTVQN